jgi:virulence factor Mce-like protein
MRRIATILVLVLAAGGFAVLTGGASDEAKGNEYKVELDNAFGLIEGGDFKIAGVRAGKITTLELDRKTKHAIVGFEVTQDGFGSLRTDARCEVAPQSLVGEYYVNCQPGTAKKELDPGATIPVEQTSTTVPPDLVTNIFRLPVRERLSLVVNELGAAVAGNADELNEAIRRASPALRETNKVLAVLGRQNQVLADLARDADVVIGDLAENRRQVSRFVTSARRISADSAERDRDIAAGFERLPTFLEELRPTMAQLKATVDEQGPALQNFARSADQLERLFENLPPFAKASRPAFRSLGEASEVGVDAVSKAGPTVDELKRYTSGLPELGQNLRIILDHLDDRNFSAEEDPRSPGGKGYTGLEALLQYIFDQAMSTNIHDGEVHILKALPFEGACAQYADIAAAKELAKECTTALGPNQIGINFPDTTAPPGYDGADRGPAREEPDPVPPQEVRADRDSGEAGGPRPSGLNGTPDDGDKDEDRKLPLPDQSGPPVRVPELKDILPGAPQAPKAPEVPPAANPQNLDQVERSKDQMLDYLLGQ